MTPWSEARKARRTGGALYDDELDSVAAALGRIGLARDNSRVEPLVFDEIGPLTAHLLITF